MKKRMLMLGLLVVMGLFSAQIAAQDIQPTLDAGVQQLFTATAQAQAYGTMALTIEAQFQAALTATAENPNALTLTAYTQTSTVDPGQITETAIAQMTARPAELQTELVRIASPLQLIPGTTFQMGTTPPEVAVAVQQCVEVEGGACTLEMGVDSVPEHPVTLSPYQIETTEVSYFQYISFLNAMGPNSHRDDCNYLPCAFIFSENELSNIRFDGTTYSVEDTINAYPVAMVTWNGADTYCRSIGRRLPTEAEWEHAARGDANGIYPWGATWNPDLARTSIPATDQTGSVSIAAYLSAAFGLYDMAGNVAEWVSDWYSPTYYIDLYNQRQAAVDPIGPTAGDQRVVRGGSWDAKPFFARSVHRQSADPFSGYAWLGFRCVADPPVEEPTLAITLIPTLLSATPTARVTLTPTPAVEQSATPGRRATIEPTRRPPVQATPTFTPTATG